MFPRLLAVGVRGQGVAAKFMTQVFFDSYCEVLELGRVPRWIYQSLTPIHLSHPPTLSTIPFPGLYVPKTTTFFLSILYTSSSSPFFLSPPFHPPLILAPLYSFSLPSPPSPPTSIQHPSSLSHLTTHSPSRQHAQSS